MNFDKNDADLIGVGRPSMGETAAVVVPKEAALARVGAMIDPGSGIVAFRVAGDEDKLMLYYEGNRYGAENLKKWDERVEHAYGRMAAKYPTTAMICLDASLFDVVGTTDGARVDVFDRAALARWEPQAASKSPRP